MAIDKLSVSIVTLNEEKNIRRCLRSVEWADEFIVVDSGSTDRTVEIAEQFGAKIIYKEFINYSSQKRYSINQCTHDWVLLLDADEEVSDNLAMEIRQILASGKEENGYSIRRISEFLDKKIYHGEWGSDYVTRLFRKSKAVVNDASVHEVVEIEGRTGKIMDPLFHYPYESLDHYLDKLNKYTGMIAEEMLEKGRNIHFYDIFTHGVFKFFRAYFLKSGFLDGRRGLLLAVYSSFYVMMKYTKAWELKFFKNKHS